MLKQRQEALKQAQQAGAVAGNTTATGNAGANLPPPVLTGTQSSTESSPATMPAPAPVVKRDDPDPEKAKDCFSVYRDLNLRKFFVESGAVRKSDEGFFYAKEHEEVQMLEYYTMIGKVEKIS